MLYHREFPVTQTTSSEVPFELTIRGDIVYLDDDVTFQGLKKMEIYARKLLSNGKVLNLTVGLYKFKIVTVVSKGLSYEVSQNLYCLKAYVHNHVSRIVVKY